MVGSALNAVPTVVIARGWKLQLGSQMATFVAVLKLMLNWSWQLSCCTVQLAEKLQGLLDSHTCQVQEIGKNEVSEVSRRNINLKPVCMLQPQNKRA